MKFTMTIELGNDAMRTRRHLVHAIAKVSRRIDHDGVSVKNEKEPQAILDLNGNTVGHWSLTKED